MGCNLMQHMMPHGTILYLDKNALKNALNKEQQQNKVQTYAIKFQKMENKLI